jgi:inhibitor of growth protein 3
VNLLSPEVSIWSLYDQPPRQLARVLWRGITPTLTTMPRDDLSIDWNRRMMPLLEHQDAAAVLDDFINRAANLPEEIKHMQDEIAAKDKQIQICMDVITSRDASIQRWIRMSSPLVVNPKEEQLRRAVLENYDKVQLLQEEKCALAQKTQQAVDRHIKYLDLHIKALQDRGDFPTDPNLPSLLRPSSARSTGLAGLGTPALLANITKQPTNAAPSLPRPANQQGATQRLNSQIQAQSSGNYSASAPATPAAALLLKRHDRESSAGANNKRPRLAGSATGTSSGLARHSSIGPATPKAGTPSATRAGSAQPRTSQKTTGAGKKVAPHKQGAVRKGKPGKSGLSRVKRSGNKNSPTSTNDSELSEAESGSDAEEDEAVTPPPSGRHDEKDEDMVDVEDDEGGDDKKYCVCQSVSYGDMVACDNESCPLEWFHWNCVGLKSEPVGTWICPVCTKNSK